MTLESAFYVRHPRVNCTEAEADIDGNEDGNRDGHWDEDGDRDCGRGRDKDRNWNEEDRQRWR